MPTTKPRRREKPGIRGRLKAHDPFELIRWLALSQTDPRKALAELVQNSLDAQAKTIRISRYRAKGVGHLRIFDDGEGVIPEMDRPEALRYIATHIGHSRKRHLSPQERFQLLTQGQYGIGLLGFWSLGEMLDMRSAVPGQKPHRLLLFRDQATFRIEPIAGRLALDERWTEIVVSNVHPDAQRVLVGRRAAEYLAAELRGQLLARATQVVIEDRISRGRGQKRIVVKPPQFLGERIAGLDSVDVPGHPPVRVEVYWSGDGSGADGAGIRVYAAGTQAAEDFRGLASLGLDGPPWTDARLSGFVDFPALRIAPGSRRGVVVDEAAEELAGALGALAPVLEEALAELDERRAADLEKGIILELQRA
ncbi:MAG: ATP-binding protein, partial [Candidatus Eiseniibacteriota bacterium]